MKLVAGICLNNLNRPRVWAKDSPNYVSSLKSIMISYAEFRKRPQKYTLVLRQGLQRGLNIPLEIYLDNGAFSFTRTGANPPYQEYVDFVKVTKPDWYAIPRDYIPAPSMNKTEQKEAFQKTMQVNRHYANNGYVPILHISNYLEKYIKEFQIINALKAKTRIGLGGIVPNLLRQNNSMHHTELFDKVRLVRDTFPDKELHLFGVGGIGTLHIAALLGADSVDTSGWSIRAGYGKIHISGKTDCSIVDLSNWKQRKLNRSDMERLEACECLSCKKGGIENLKIPGMEGKCNRASHNLHTLLLEKDLIEHHISAGTYNDWYKDHLKNPILLPLIHELTGNVAQLKLF